MQTECVDFAVQTKSLNIIQVNLILKIANRVSGIVALEMPSLLSLTYVSLISTSYKHKISFCSTLNGTVFQNSMPSKNILKFTHKITRDILFFTNHTERKKLFYTYAYKSYPLLTLLLYWTVCLTSIITNNPTTIITIFVTTMNCCGLGSATTN